MYTEFYKHIREKAPIADIIKKRIKLTQKGSEYIALCPLHNEKTPSFTVNDRKKFFYCFGCHAYGDVIKFISLIDMISYKDAAIAIAKDYGLDLPKIFIKQRYTEFDKIYEILELAANFFYQQKNIEVENYLKNRNITAEIKEKQLIGYASNDGTLVKFFSSKSIAKFWLLKAGLLSINSKGKEYELFSNRIIIPIRDLYQRVVGFGARAIDGNKAKYLNSPETIVFKKGSVLYGENLALSTVSKENSVIVVEGYFDVISLNQIGFTNVVASLGTSITKQHLEKLWHYYPEIIICLDGDLAGYKSMIRLLNMALSYVTSNKTISFIQIPNKLDPDQLIRLLGFKGFKKLLDHRMKLSEKIWQIEYQGKEFLTAESKTILERSLENYCKQINDKLLASNFLRYFKNQMWVYLHKRKNTSIVIEPVVVNNSYSEIEMIEYALLSFMVRYPIISTSFAIKSFFLKVDFSHKILNEFRDWFYDQANDNTKLTFDQIGLLVKNTRFYNQFLVLLESRSLHLNQNFIDDNNEEGLLLAFEWVQKKYYLTKLKQECSVLLYMNTEKSYIKAELYLVEIKKTVQELSKLNDLFIK